MKGSCREKDEKRVKIELTNNTSSNRSYKKIFYNKKKNQYLFDNPLVVACHDYTKTTPCQAIDIIAPALQTAFDITKLILNATSSCNI